MILDQQEPEHAERLPEVVLSGEGGPLFEQPTKTGDSVMLAVERIGAQQPTVFRDQQKQEAIDEDQQLAIKPLGSDPLVAGARR